MSYIGRPGTITVYVSNYGDDVPQNGQTILTPYKTIEYAYSQITDASASKLYSICYDGIIAIASSTLEIKPWIALVALSPSSTIDINGGNGDIDLDPSSWGGETDPVAWIQGGIINGHIFLQVTNLSPAPSPSWVGTLNVYNVITTKTGGGGGDNVVNGATFNVNWYGGTMVAGFDLSPNVVCVFNDLYIPIGQIGSQNYVGNSNYKYVNCDFGDGTVINVADNNSSYDAPILELYNSRVRGTGLFTQSSGSGSTASIIIRYDADSGPTSLTLAGDETIEGGEITNASLGLMDSTQGIARYLDSIPSQLTSDTTAGISQFGSYVILNSASAFTITLPEQSTTPTLPGVNMRFLNIGTGTVTFIKEGSETLTGNTLLTTNQTMYVERSTITNWATFGGTAVLTSSFDLILQAIAGGTTVYFTVAAPGPGILIDLSQAANSLGTAGTYTVAIDGTNVTGLTTITNTTTKTTTAATANNTFVYGSVITIAFTSTVAGVNWQGTLRYTSNL